MKFAITRTSNYASDKKPCEGVSEEDFELKHKGNVVIKRKIFTKEINTLEELMDFIKEVGGELIISDYDVLQNKYPMIEIYDDYRE